MRLFLTILFLLLFLLNGEICSFFYGYDPEDKTTFHLFEGWYYTRDKIYEIMHFIAVLIALLKPTLKSSALLIGTGFVIFCSVLDKSFQGVFTYHYHDILVLFGGFLFTISFYLYGSKKSK